jgi:general stress protein 26
LTQSRDAAIQTCHDLFVNETSEELDALQRLIDRSVASSGAHLLGIVTAPRRLSARQLVAAVTGMKVIVVATVTAAGEPRTSCADGHFLSGTWTFSTDSGAHKARQLRARPAVSVTHVDGERLAVFTHGRAELTTAHDPGFQAFEDHFVNHYGSSPREWSPDPVFIRVRPTWMIGFAMNAHEFPAA